MDVGVGFTGFERCPCPCHDDEEPRKNAHKWWQHNVRAIGLGLQALRAVDRYGITSGREQYRGFAELPSGIAVPAGWSMSVEESAKFICRHAGMSEATWGGLLDSIRNGAPEMQFEPAYRMAAKRLHPDAGGTADLFQKLQEARRVLEEFGRAAR